jgi:hypothetical protein
MKWLEQGDGSVVVVAAMLDLKVVDWVIWVR